MKVSHHIYIHVVGGDHTKPDGYETSAEDEIKPLIEEINQNRHNINHPETELVELQNSCDDGDKIPAIVIEADFPGKNYKTKKDNANELPIVTNEADMADAEISDATNYCNTENYDTFDTTAANNNDQTTSYHDTNLTTSNLDLAPATNYPLAIAKLRQSYTLLLSIKSNSSLPKSANSALLSIKSNTTDDEEDFWDLGCILNLLVYTMSQ